MNADFAIDLVTALWLGFVGACIGSFLNVVAYRMPRGISIVWKPSHCPQCGHPIRARDNVPVLGWLLLRGKCRDCGKPISPRYAIVEAAMGTTFFLLAYVELFSGGANLLGGPTSPFFGSVDNVWNPYWPIIFVYAYHCTALSFLMAFTLIDQDDSDIPSILFVLAVVVGIGPPIAAEWLKSEASSQNPFLFAESATLGYYFLSIAVFTIFAGSLTRLGKLTPNSTRQISWNLFFAYETAFLFLGCGLLQAVLFILCSIAFLVSSLPRLVGLSRRMCFLPQLWLSFIALLLLGNTIKELLEPK